MAGVAWAIFLSQFFSAVAEVGRGLKNFHSCICTEQILQNLTDPRPNFAYNKTDFLWDSRCLFVLCDSCHAGVVKLTGVLQLLEDIAASHADSFCNGKQ